VGGGDGGFVGGVFTVAEWVAGGVVLAPAVEAGTEGIGVEVGGGGEGGK
jgi:hypothetical protein